MEEFSQDFKAKALELGTALGADEVAEPLRPTYLDVEAIVTVSAPGPSTAVRLKGFDQTFLLAAGTRLTTRDRSGSTDVWVESVGLAQNGLPASRSLRVAVSDRSNLTIQPEDLGQQVYELVLQLGTETRTYSVSQGEVNRFDAKNLLFKDLAPGTYNLRATARKSFGSPIVVDRTITVRKNIEQMSSVSMLEVVPFQVLELGTHAAWAGQEVDVLCKGVSDDATLTVGATEVPVSRRQSGSSPGQTVLYFTVPASLTGGTLQVSSNGQVLSPPQAEFKRIHRVSLSPATASVKARATFNFSVKAFDSTGSEITPFPGVIQQAVLDGASPEAISSGNLRIGNFGTSGKYTAGTAGEDILLIGKVAGHRAASELVPSNELAIARVTVE